MGIDEIEMTRTNANNEFMRNQSALSASLLHLLSQRM